MKSLFIIVPFMFLIGCNSDSTTETDKEEIKYVIETKVNGPEECVGSEQYDAQNSVCFIECDTFEECEEKEAKLDEALDALEDEYTDIVTNITKFDSNNSVDDKELQNAEAVYKIDINETFILLSGSENSEHLKIKEWLRSISPNDFSDKYLSRLVLMPTHSDDSAAYVTLSSYGTDGSWDIFVNMQSLRDGGEKEMVFTLIHEYTHILTLNDSQLDVSISPENCTNYHTGAEGCTEKNSYLNQFIQNFWIDLLASKPDAENYYDYYDQHPTEFVRDYAATSPIEDIAESFASFVFKKDRSENSVADKKVDFFYSYPELVEIRASIRESLKKLVRDTI